MTSPHSSSADSVAQPASRHEPVHDVVGIGIGPFNLGLACLTQPLDDVDAVFLDAREGFAWHHGMMLPEATIQVPFLADLVTMADPTSEFSFLNWLKHTGRLYPFYIREDFHPLRSEYDDYCRWAAQRLPALRWGRQVESVEHDAATDTFVVTAVTAEGVEIHRGRHVVMGIGTAPQVPTALHEDVDASPAATHSADYLHRREEILASGSATVVGSGQSAAEIFLDLLEAHREHGLRLDWITRSPRFFSMEDTRLTLEMTSPEYTDHFHGLPEEMRDRLSREQRGLYKGISTATIDQIHDALYRLSAHGPLEVGMLTETEVTAAVWDEESRTHRLQLEHRQLGEQAEHRTGHLVLATGYAPREPACLAPVEHLIGRDSAGRLAAGRDYRIDTLGGRIFVQNAEEHTHGLSAPDLGMGAWRNASILATITGEEIYPLERRIAFQQFGLPTTAEVH